MSEKVGKIKDTIQEKHTVFYDSVQGLSVADLRKNVLMYSKYLQETLASVKTCREIEDAEIRLKGAKKPFTDKIKEHKDKIKQLKRFVDDGVCTEDLENHMVTNTLASEDQKIRMSDNQSVKDASDEVKLLKGPFTEAKNVLNLKIAYLNILINEKEGFEPGYRDGQE